MADIGVVIFLGICFVVGIGACLSCLYYPLDYDSEDEYTARAP